jgi:hypothetical protein
VVQLVFTLGSGVEGGQLTAANASNPSTVVPLPSHMSSRRRVLVRSSCSEPAPPARRVRVSADGTAQHQNAARLACFAEWRSDNRGGGGERVD